MSPQSTSAGGGGIDLPTLAITAVASAAAAYVCSQLWAPGALPAAAAMPVLVALLKEALARPTYAVTRAVPVRGVVRSTPPPDEPFDPIQPFQPEDERVPQYGEVSGSSRPYAGRAWKMAVITGLLGFLIAAVIITVPEFVAGKAASGGDRQTTLFGGEKKSSAPATTTTTTTPQETETTPPAATVTIPPVETTTVPPPTTTVPPAETTPAPPAQTTPAPAPPAVP